jgi:nitrate reductase NapD
MNVSSAVVQTNPESLDKVIDLIKECDFCDYHLHDEKGRIVVTIEGDEKDEELDKFNKIKMIPGVISVSLMYSYSED